jgi:predicted RNA-binding protein with EMAP domain
MYKMVNFARATDSLDPPDIIKECQEMKKLRKNISSVSVMLDREKKFYNERLDLADERYKNFSYWTKVLQN